MHGDLEVEHPGQFGQVLRHRCRNPRCRMKLKVPVENPHKAFCTPGCYSSFYLKRCLVCEKAKPSGRSDRRFCRKPSCRNQYHRNPVLYDLGEPKTGPSTGPAHLALKSPIKSRAFSGLEPDRPYRIVAGPALSESAFRAATIPLDSELVTRLTRLHKEYYRAAAAKALIKPTDPPINILGGYKYPHASSIGWNRPTPSTNRAHNQHLAEVPDGLSIPKFLKRGPVS
jgi:hypothetical protein